MCFAPHVHSFWLKRWSSLYVWLKCLWFFLHILYVVYILNTELPIYLSMGLYRVLQSTSRPSVWWAYWTSHAPDSAVQSRGRWWAQRALSASLWSICTSLPEGNYSTHSCCKSVIPQSFLRSISLYLISFIVGIFVCYIC
jgi:hypothetical protein